MLGCKYEKLVLSVVSTEIATYCIETYVIQMPMCMDPFTEQTFYYLLEFLYLYSVVLKVVMKLCHIFAPQCILATILCLVRASGVDVTEQVN
jgi:hypothetical protein